MPVCRECFNYKTNIQSQEKEVENADAAETVQANEIGTGAEDIEADVDNGNESDMYYSAHEEASSDEAEGANSAQNDAQNLPAIDQLNLSPPVIKFGA